MAHVLGLSSAIFVLDLHYLGYSGVNIPYRYYYQPLFNLTCLYTMLLSVLFLTDKNQPNPLSLAKITQYCPQLEILAEVSSLDNASEVLKEEKPQLVIIDLADSLIQGLQMLMKRPCFDFEVIILSNNRAHFTEAIKHCALGFILKPINMSEFILTVQHAEQRIRAKEELESKIQPYELSWPLHKVIGVPTIEGYEFISIEDIIRCEGLQKCTRVVVKGRKDIVSSYNLGEFRKLLEPFGFQSPHKSFIINLGEIVKYYREGRIEMSDSISVPVARRRKNDFLDLLLHL